MCKNNYFLSIIMMLATMSLFGADINTPQTDATEKDHQVNEAKKVSEEIKKNKAEIETIKKKKVLSGGFALIEPMLQKIIADPQFQAGIEKMAAQEAQSIAQGKTFSSVKHSHSLSQDFSALSSANKFFAWVYTLMANIAHYELLLSKLSNTEQKQQQASTEESSPAQQKAMTESLGDEKTAENQSLLASE